MANKKISELQSRTPSLSDLLLVGDPSSGYSYKCTVTALATIIETDIADGYVTIGTTQTISGAKTFSNNLTLTSVSNANTDTDKFLVLNGSNVVNFRTGAEVLSDIGGQGALTLTTTGSSGASTLVGNTLNIPTYTLSGLGGISGSGNTGYLPKFTGTTSIGNSIVQDNGSTLNIAGGIICNAISASSLTSDQYIAFQNINTSYSLSGYTMLYATLTNPGFIFNFGDGTRSAIFRYAAGSYTYTLPSATGTLALTSDITSSISGTANYIPKFTGSNSIGNSVIYESSSNIGIGTISPAQKLEVAGTLRVRSATEILDISAPVGKIDFNNVSGDPIGFSIGSSEKMRLDASGNLGLGVTPSAWVNTRAAISIKNGAELTGYANGFELMANAYNDGNWKYIASSFASGYQSVSGGHFWYTAPSGTAGNAISFTQAMTLTASGNLGIGTTSPASKLQIGSVGSTGYAVSNGLAFGDGTRAGALDVTASGTNLFSSTDLIFWANTTERMRITSAGNVGIGTTSPVARLHIENSASADPTSLSSVPTTNIFGMSTSPGGMLAAGIGATGGTYVWLQGRNVGGAGVSYPISLQPLGGNVGIGTTAPQLNLHIFTSGTSFTSSTVTYSSATSRGILLDNSAGTNQSGNAIWFANSGLYSAIASTRESTGDWGTDIRFYTHPTTTTNQYDVTERMRITSGGNVLIGTTTGDGYKLQLNGNSQASSTFGQTYSTVAAYSQWVNSSGAFAMGLDGADGSTERMRITSGGEVYIAGTTDQGAYNLQVNGTGVWGAGAYVNGSDRSLKENIYDLDGCLELVKQLKPVTYKYKESYSKDTSTQTGFIAQDLKELFKDKSYLNGLVKEGGQHLSVAYQNLIPLLVKAIQEQQAEIEILKNK